MSKHSSDSFAVRVVVCTLAVISVLGVASVAYLAIAETAVPDQLDRLVTAALTALGVILSRTSSEKTTQQVEVVNTDTDPVPVDPAPKK